MLPSTAARPTPTACSALWLHNRDAAQAPLLPAAEQQRLVRVYGCARKVRRAALVGRALQPATPGVPAQHMPTSPPACCRLPQYSLAVGEVGRRQLNTPSKETGLRGVTKNKGSWLSRFRNKEVYCRSKEAAITSYDTSAIAAYGR